MTERWAEMEFGNLDLVDKRLNKRAVKLIETFAKAPKFKCSSSLPRLSLGTRDLIKPRKKDDKSRKVQQELKYCVALFQ